MKRTFKKFTHKLLRKILPHLPKKLQYKLVLGNLKLDYHLPHDVTFKIADTEDELLQAYEIIHDCYVEMKYDIPHEEKIRVTKYHALPHTSVLIIKIKDEVVGTCTFVPDGPFGLPIESISNITDLRKNSEHIVEISALAIKKEYRKWKTNLLIPLVKYCFKYINEYKGADRAVIAVAPESVWYYELLFGFFKVTAKPQEYSMVQGAKAMVLHVHYKDSRKKIWHNFSHLEKEKNIYSYLYNHKFEHNFEYPQYKEHLTVDSLINPHIIETFFKKKVNLLDQMEPKDLLTLRYLYHRKSFLDKMGGDHLVGHPDIKDPELRYMVKCRIKIYDPITHTFLDGRAANISENGIKISLKNSIHESLKERKQLIIKIRLDDDEQVNLLTIPCWGSEGNQFGLRILNSENPVWQEFIQRMNEEYLTSTEQGEEALGA